MLLQSQVHFQNQQTLLIYERNTLHEIKKMFIQIFPFLQLEFYYPNSPREAIKEKYKTLREFGLGQPFFSIDSNTTVDQVEKYFATGYGLPIHIYRKEQNERKSTRENINWNLRTHNQAGAEKTTDLGFLLFSHIPNGNRLFQA